MDDDRAATTKRRVLPSRRAIAILLVAGTATASLALPGAAVVLTAIALVLWIVLRADAHRTAETYRVERDLPARVPQGEWMDLRWTVRARRRGVRALVLTEHLPDSFDTDGDVQPCFRLPAGGNGRAGLRLRARRRGTWTVGPGVGRVLGPRGLGWLRLDIVPPQEVRVDPTVEPLRRLSLETSRTRWLGGQARRLRGVGSEFESLRDYRADDDFRWIDWKASARRRKLTSREFQVDEHQSVVFLLDTGRLMASEEGDRTKLDHALGAALAIGHVVMKRGDNLGLLAFDRESRVQLRPGRGRGHSLRFHEALSRLQPTLVEPDYALAFARLQSMVHKRSLILVFTDLVDERVSEQLISRVSRVSRRHLPIVITLSDTALLDTVARQPESTRDAYENAVAADALLLRDRAIARLRTAGVRVVDSPADQLAADAVESYLRVRRENRV